MGRFETLSDRMSDTMNDASEFAAILRRLPDDRLPLVRQILRRLATLQRGRSRYLAMKGGRK